MIMIIYYNYKKKKNKLLQKNKNSDDEGKMDDTDGNNISQMLEIKKDIEQIDPSILYEDYKLMILNYINQKCKKFTVGDNKGDDSGWLLNGNKLEGFQISSGSWIDSISLKVDGEWIRFGGDGGNSQERVELDNDEQINSFYLTSEFHKKEDRTYIHELMIGTNKGRIFGTYGTKMGEEKTLISGKKLYDISIRAEQYINGITFNMMIED